MENIQTKKTYIKFIYVYRKYYTHFKKKLKKFLYTYLKKSIKKIKIVVNLVKGGE